MGVLKQLCSVIKQEMWSVTSQSILDLFHLQHVVQQINQLGNCKNNEEDTFTIPKKKFCNAHVMYSILFCMCFGVMTLLLSANRLNDHLVCHLKGEEKERLLLPKYVPKECHHSKTCTGWDAVCNMHNKEEKIVELWMYPSRYFLQFPNWFMWIVVHKNVGSCITTTCLTFCPFSIGIHGIQTNTIHGKFVFSRLSTSRLCCPKLHVRKHFSSTWEIQTAITQNSWQLSPDNFQNCF